MIKKNSKDEIFLDILSSRRHISIDGMKKSYFQETGVWLKRTTIISVFYRLVHRGYVYAVSGKVGIYSTNRYVIEQIENMRKK